MHNSCAIGAENHADADFVGTLRDGVGCDAVEADSGEDQRDDAEEAGEAGGGTLLIKRKLDLLLHGSNAGDGQIGIELGERSGEQGLKHACGRVGDEHDAADEVGTELESFHELIVVVHHLGERDIEHGTRSAR